MASHKTTNEIFTFIWTTIGTHNKPNHATLFATAQSKIMISSTYFPTKFSSTDDLPALWPPTTAICGRSNCMCTPSCVNASCSLFTIGMSASIPWLPDILVCRGWLSFSQLQFYSRNWMKNPEGGTNTHSKFLWTIIFSTHTQFNTPRKLVWCFFCFFIFLLLLLCIELVKCFGWMIELVAAPLLALSLYLTRGFLALFYHCHCPNSNRYWFFLPSRYFLFFIVDDVIKLFWCFNNIPTWNAQVSLPLAAAYPSFP